MKRYSSLVAAIFCLLLELTPGHVKRVKDGDTFVLYHVGVPPQEVVRVMRVDTPEPGQPLAAEATQFTTTWLQAGPFTLTTCKRDGFGRLLGVVERNDEELAEVLIGAGLAVQGKW